MTISLPLPLVSAAFGRDFLRLFAGFTGVAGAAGDGDGVSTVETVAARDGSAAIGAVSSVVSVGTDSAVGGVAQEKNPNAEITAKIPKTMGSRIRLVRVMSPV
jgi:hypothetical protein